MSMAVGEGVEKGSMLAVEEGGAESGKHSTAKQTPRDPPEILGFTEVCAWAWAASEAAQWVKLALVTILTLALRTHPRTGPPGARQARAHPALLHLSAEAGIPLTLGIPPEHTSPHPGARGHTHAPACTHPHARTHSHASTEGAGERGQHLTCGDKNDGAHTHDAHAHARTRSCWRGQTAWTTC